MYLPTSQYPLTHLLHPPHISPYTPQSSQTFTERPHKKQPSLLHRKDGTRSLSSQYRQWSWEGQTTGNNAIYINII